MSKNTDLGRYSTNTVPFGAITVGANVVINSTTIAVGSMVINSTFLGPVAQAAYVQNTDSRVLSGNLNFTGANIYFSTAAYIGANVTVNTTSLFIGNSTVNTSINSSSISINNVSLGTMLAIYYQAAYGGL